MKRFLSLFVLIALLATLLVSCNLPGHEHTFAEEWTSDSDYHWHACTASEECTEKSDSAAHDYETTTDAAGKLINLCKVCGYSNEKVSTAPAHDHVFAEEYAHSSGYATKKQ